MVAMTVSDGRLYRHAALLTFLLAFATSAALFTPTSASQAALPFAAPFPSFAKMQPLEAARSGFKSQLLHSQPLATGHPHVQT